MAGVIVIGAGVVGLSAALAAQARGLSVTVIDRDGPAAGASAGNAGAFAFSDILPLDRWFGCFHDGSPEAEERMKERVRARKAKLAEKAARKAAKATPAE